MEVMPSQEEQNEVWEYCCVRPLTRPDTDIKRAIFSTLAFLAVIAVLSVGTGNLLFWLGSHFQLIWFDEHPIITWVLACVGCFLIGLIVMLKIIIIGSVRLYQHYASDELRRKCILKPTCSEYMILAVKKYGVIRGVAKGVHRLLVTCRGFTYHVDEP